MMEMGLAFVHWYCPSTLIGSQQRMSLPALVYLKSVSVFEMFEKVVVRLESIICVNVVMLSAQILEPWTRASVPDNMVHDD